MNFLSNWKSQKASRSLKGSTRKSGSASEVRTSPHPSPFTMHTSSHRGACRWPAQLWGVFPAHWAPLAPLSALLRTTYSPSSEEAKLAPFLGGKHLSGVGDGAPLHPEGQPAHLSPLAVAQCPSALRPVQLPQMAAPPPQLLSFSLPRVSASLVTLLFMLMSHTAPVSAGHPWGQGH